jgi:hypothetical protein
MNVKEAEAALELARAEEQAKLEADLARANAAQAARRAAEEAEKAERYKAWWDERRRGGLRCYLPTGMTASHIEFCSSQRRWQRWDGVYVTGPETYQVDQDADGRLLIYLRHIGDYITLSGSQNGLGWERANSHLQQMRAEISPRNNPPIAAQYEERR